MSDSKVIEAFQLMWGNLPEPALLVHKSKKIIAVNAASRKAGRIEGTVCATYGGPETHKGCMANQALATQQPKFLKKKYGDREIISYWLPIDGNPDLYVHFNIGVMVDYIIQSRKEEWVFNGITAVYETMLKYLGWQECGKILAYGCYHRTDIEKTDYPNQAYELGRGL